MRNLILLLLIFTSANYAFAAFGGMDPGAINKSYMRDMRLHEIESRAKDRNAIIKKSNETEAKEYSPAVNINSIKFVNNKNISSEELSNLVEYKISQPLNEQNISDIRKEVMKYYQKQGFISAVAFVVSTDKSGEVVIEVEEGQKNSIIIE